MITGRLQEAYSIERAIDNDYKFTTDTGVTYIIYSLPGRYFIPGFIFSNNLKYIGFRPINGIRIKGEIKRQNWQDEKIMNTIFNFLFNLFEDNDIIMAFNYYSEDGKGPARNRLFNKFYLQYGQHLFHKMDFQLEKVGTASIIFRKDNKYFTEICTIKSEDIIRNIQRLQRR